MIHTRVRAYMYTVTHVRTRAHTHIYYIHIYVTSDMPTQCLCTLNMANSQISQINQPKRSQTCTHAVILDDQVDWKSWGFRQQLAKCYGFGVDRLYCWGTCQTWPLLWTMSILGVTFSRTGVFPILCVCVDIYIFCLNSNSVTTNIIYSYRYIWMKLKLTGEHVRHHRITLRLVKSGGGGGWEGGLPNWCLIIVGVFCSWEKYIIVLT